MITDDFFIYLLIQIILLVINLIGYSKIPLLGAFGAIFTALLAWPTVQAFGTYSSFALMLIVINISLPAIGISRALR